MEESKRKIKMEIEAREIEKFSLLFIFFFYPNFEFLVLIICRPKLFLGLGFFEGDLII